MTIEEIVASSKDPDTVLKKLMARIMEDLKQKEKPTGK